MLHPTRRVRSYPSAFYVRQLKLRVRSFSDPARSRLLWLPVHVSIVAGATAAIAWRWLPLPALPALSLLIGLAFGGLMFLGHETMHGAVIRGTWARSLVGAACFAPFAVSPRLWAIWHNRGHHATANRLDIDPDMYPSLDAYRRSRLVRFATDNFALGGRRWRGLLCLALGFTVQSVEVLIMARSRLRISARDHRRAIVETALMIALWATIASLIGAIPFVLAYVLPLGVANVVVMSFIVTNHGLSAATETSDPMLGSLSVTAPRWVEWLTLGFGYHVEHHLFPAASARHGPAIRAALVELWPERYQSMPIGEALARLFSTGRVYRDAVTLVDPISGGSWSALAPADALASATASRLRMR